MLAGSASALFLFSLDWATRTREAHRWLILGLPLVGFAVGWLYLKWGQSVDGGNNLLIPCGPLDQRPIEALGRQDVLIFTAPPLTLSVPSPCPFDVDRLRSPAAVRLPLTTCTVAS